MSTFLALYRGETVGGAKLVAVSADPTIVTDFARRLLKDPPSPERDEESDRDPVLASIEQGRRRALRLISRERA